MKEPAQDSRLTPPPAARDNSLATLFVFLVIVTVGTVVFLVMLHSRG